MITSIDPRGHNTRIKLKNQVFPWNCNNLIPPNLDEFTWYNRASCSYQKCKNRVQLIVPDIGSTDHVHILAKALPVPNTVSHTITMIASLNPTKWNIYSGTALYLMVGDTTTWRGFCIFQNASNLMKDASPYYIVTWAGGTAASAVTGVGGFSDVSYIGIRMYSTITNRFWQVSPDGYNWKTLITEGGNDYTTATHYGIGLYNSNNNGSPGADLKIDLFHLSCVLGNPGNSL